MPVAPDGSIIRGSNSPNSNGVNNSSSPANSWNQGATSSAQPITPQYRNPPDNRDSGSTSSRFIYHPSDRHNVLIGPFSPRAKIVSAVLVIAYVLISVYLIIGMGLLEEEDLVLLSVIIFGPMAISLLVSLFTSSSIVGIILSGVGIVYVIWAVPAEELMSGLSFILIIAFCIPASFLCSQLLD